MKPLYIFDLDSTLALTDHRTPILTDGKPDPWPRFFKACVDDVPNEPVIATMRALSMMAEVWIWTGREALVVKETTAWLKEHTGFSVHLIERITRMRELGDRRPDHEIKLEWLEGLTPRDQRRLVAVFDGRDPVVAMWRANNVPCFQVASDAF